MKLARQDINSEEWLNNKGIKDSLKIKDSGVFVSMSLINSTCIGEKDCNDYFLVDEVIGKNEALQIGITYSNIKEINASFSNSEINAIFAIECLMKREGLYGDSTLFTKAEYFDAYGVSKSITPEGWVKYNSEQSKKAFEALKALNKPKLWVIKKPFGREIKGKRKQKKIEGISATYKVFFDELSINDGTIIDDLDAEGKVINVIKEGGKKGLIEVVRNKLFRYGGRLNLNKQIFKDLKKIKNCPKELVIFYLILARDATFGNRDVYVYRDTLITQLRLDKLSVKYKQRVNEKLDEVFKHAKTLKWLDSYKVKKTKERGDQYIFTTSEPYFYRKKSIT